MILIPFYKAIPTNNIAVYNYTSSIEELINDSGEDEAENETTGASNAFPTSTTTKTLQEYQEECALLRREITILRAENDNLKRENEDLRRVIKVNTDSVEEAKKIEDLLSSIFSKNQLHLLMNKKRKVNWTQNEIQVAFAIRYLSKRCYNYLKDELKYPLPSISSLKSWANGIEMNRGILTNVIQIMKAAGAKLKNKDKICVLAFDEMSIKRSYEYNIQKDEIYGPFKNIQVNQL